MPFFNNIPGLHSPRPGANRHRNDQITHKNEGYNGDFDDSWFHNFGTPEDQFSAVSHDSHNSYEDFDPFFNPYYQGNNWDHMPGMNNVLNVPNPEYNNHRHRPTHNANIPQENPKPVHNDVTNVPKPEENPKEIPPVDNTPTEQNKGPKLNDDKISDVKNKVNEATISEEKKNPEENTPKTNEIKEEDDKGDKEKKQVDLDKKKDYLLVGQGNNANDVYLLHENIPNPTGVFTTNTNQPGNNIIYVPYNPSQPNNQVYQVVNGQPVASPGNVQMTQEKVGTNDYNNIASTPIVNSGSQNPGYVTIYSNGQLIQIPGVVVNQAPNNVPAQTGNQVQGTNYVIANANPNNVQIVPSNPGTNVIYATIPNQASNGPIYVQVPNCCDSGAIIQNPVNNGISNNGLPSNVVVYQANPNTVAQPAVSDGSNVYVQSNMVPTQGQGIYTVSIPNQPNQGNVFSNQNVVYQPAGQQPVNRDPNVYNQPIVSSLGQGQNAPNQGGVMNNQNVPIQTAVQMPVASNNNGYSQPTTTVNQRQDINPPNQGLKYNQNMPDQTAIVIPIPSGYNENPPVINPSPTIETRDAIPNNQNQQPQLAVVVDTDSNGYNQPQVTNQGNQGANANTPSGAVINQEIDVSQPIATSSLVLDSNNLSSLGAQPAIMIADFKEKSDDKKDKKKNEDKEEKKGKKEVKKAKDDDKSKEDEKKDDKPQVDQPEAPGAEPFTNKKIE